MIVTERFELSPKTKFELFSRKPNMNMLGSIVYYRTYSRQKENGEQEQWADTVIRVVEGVMSIRKWWYVDNKITWNELEWQEVARKMSHAIFEMRFLPPGRGLWIAGSDHLYNRGSLAANNCQFRNVTLMSRDASLIMDGLMLGVGLGFAAEGYEPQIQPPNKALKVETYIIPDSREGWVESVRRLIASYESWGRRVVEFDYSEIRPEGAPIKTFGGIASGPEPLIKLHNRIRTYMDCYVAGACDKTRLVADVVNAIGACVVAGNVRRSAELYMGSPKDETFMNLKNYGDYIPEYTDAYGQVFPATGTKGPSYDRQDIGWMSNNSVKLSKVEDFEILPELAELIRDNGEPGVVNFVNIKQYGRLGDFMADTATGTNPCAEATLENGELCNLVEVFPTRCTNEAEYLEAVELATIYASTISLLPLHLSL